MQKQVVTIAILAFFLIGASLILSYPTLFSSVSLSPQTTSPSSLIDTTRYERYPFGENEEVIDIGTQPLWLPGIITETMKRDAILQKELKALNREVRFHSFLKGADVNHFLSSGKLEAGVGGDMPALLACSRSQITVTSIIDQSYSSLVGKGEQMVEELRGKRIGYAHASNASRMLQELLALEGIPLKEVNMLPYDVLAMPDALQRGEIDAFAAWEPIPTVALSEHPHFNIIARGVTTGYLYFKTDFINREPEVARLIIAAQLRAIEWLRSDRRHQEQASEWMLVEAERLSQLHWMLTAKELSRVIREGLLDNAVLGYIPLGELTGSGKLRKEFEFLQTTGDIPKEHDWEEVRKCFDTYVIQDIQRERERFNLKTYNYGGDRNDDSQ